MNHTYSAPEAFSLHTRSSFPSLLTSSTLSTRQLGATELGTGYAPLFCVVPLCFTAAGCIVLFFLADGVYDLLSPLARTP